MIRRALPFLFVVACSNNNHANVDAPVKHDAPAVDAPAVDAPPPDAPPPPRAGLVFITESQANGATPASAGAGAVFADNSGFGTTAGTNGACTHYTNTQSKGYSAGTITITGTASPITLNPTGVKPAVQYSSAAMVPNPAFVAGATITITGAGGPDFPAFTMTAVGPATLAGFTPSTTPISRAAGYTATWTAGAGPGMWVYLVGLTGQTFDILLCRVPDTGSYTVAPASLALLAASDTMAAVIVARVDEVTMASPNVTAFLGTAVTGNPVALTP